MSVRGRSGHPRSTLGPSRLAVRGAWLAVALALAGCTYDPVADDGSEPGDGVADAEESAPAADADAPDDEEAGEDPAEGAEDEHSDSGPAQDDDPADDDRRDREGQQAVVGHPLECMGHTATPRVGPFGQYTLEVEGPGEAWAWVREVEPFVAGEQFVVLFAITDGEGNPSFEAVHESGATIGQDDGPRERADSAWDVPAEEYAVVFVFDEPGCWVVSVARGDTEGWLPVPVEPGE